MYSPFEKAKQIIHNMVCNPVKLSIFRVSVFILSLFGCIHSTLNELLELPVSLQNVFMNQMSIY